jgi:hypothetical protein
MVRILDEPVAAAIAFGLHKGTRERMAIVYDMVRSSRVPLLPGVLLPSANPGALIHV